MDSQEKQPNRQISVCDDEGVQIFESPIQISDQSFDRRLTLPVFGRVLVYVGEKQQDGAGNQKVAFALDGKSPIRIGTVSKFAEEGLRPISITLDDADKFLDTPIQISIWLKGKSAKLTGETENVKGDGIDFGDRKIASNFSLNPDSAEGKVFVNPNFDILKEFRISAKGINAGGGDN